MTNTQPVTFTISALLGNSGNKTAPSQAVVRFYDGNPDAGGVQIGSDQSVTLRGCGATAAVSMTWPVVDLAAVDGHTLFVRVFPTGADAEQSNNQMQYPIVLAANQVFLPVIQRKVVLP